MNIIIGQQVHKPRARCVSNRVTIDLDALSMHMSKQEAEQLAAALLEAIAGPFDNPIDWERIPLTLRMLAHPFIGAQNIQPAERQALLEAAGRIEDLEDAK